MKCPKCEGKGWYHKHRNCNHDSMEAYIRGCNDQRVCMKCLGTGSTGVKLIKAALLEIKLESSDFKARRLAEKALNEWGDGQHGQRDSRE